VAAARALLDEQQGAHLEDALAEHLPTDPRDRGLAWFVAFGVLRRRGHVDAALRPCLRQPLASLDPEVQVVLRLGAFEKLFGRARAHAVVHQWVEVARAVGAGRASGLVNAVLRRAQAAEPTAAEALDHPAWLVARWRGRYGDEAAERWMQANAEPPPRFVVAPDGLPEGLDAQPARLAGREVPQVWRLDDDGPIPDLPGFDEGRFWVQDLAAVAVADLVGAGEGMRVLDACAAPGGKSFRLASQGATVVAADRSEGRLARLREAAARLGVPVATVQHDWSTGPLPKAEAFDAVLVDAPCSGLGTVRRHPEIRWRRQPSDLTTAAERQRVILAAAATHVRPAGRLIYAVCSPEPEEGQAVVDAFLDAHPHFTRVDALHTAPPSDDEDAHAAFVLERTG
jgi:16S rRNA (cytosine967-C5)-methyltransferase